MIKLSSFRPDFFDNNGDQGNLEVLAAHLAAVGVPHELSQDMSESDFLLIGDSSIAAGNHFKDDLLALVPDLKLRLLSGKPTLIVGRSYEFLAPLLGIELSQGERVSKFVRVSSKGHEAIGYHNSTVEEPKFFISGAFIGTTLFGPILAKNPSLLVAVAKGLGVELTGEFFERSVKLANQVREATTF